MNEDLLLKILSVIFIALLPIIYKNYIKAKNEYLYYQKKTNIKEEIQKKERLLNYYKVRFISSILATLVIIYLAFLN